MAQAQQHYYGTGRRKTSTARVYLKPCKSGKATVVVNDRVLDQYFAGQETCQMIVQQPIDATDMQGKFDIEVAVQGSGPKGQAGAISLGIARALRMYEIETGGDPYKEGSIRQRLRALGLLTRNAKQVERKKVGHRKARKVRQFSKR